MSGGSVAVAATAKQFEKRGLHGFYGFMEDCPRSCALQNYAAGACHGHFLEKTLFFVALRGFLGKIGGRGNPMWLPRAATQGHPYKNLFRGSVVADSTIVVSSLQIG